jgi:hypothetical protein
VMSKKRISSRVLLHFFLLFGAASIGIFKT